MLSSYPLWWLALPVLLLPIWWHRQKRQRLKAQPLASARFLPSAAPEQLRVWQWRDRLLLLVRCLMLVALIAWLAAAIFPWRGDTVLLDAGVDKAWAEQQISGAGMASARRMELPADALQWIRQHERDWRDGARLLIVARSGAVDMPARIPKFSHQVALRTWLAPVPTAASPSAKRAATHGIVLATTPERGDAWRSLFNAFGVAGDGARRYAVTAEPDARSALIVWDTPASAPPAGWRAAHWWIGAGAGAAFPELAKAASLNINGIAFHYADSPRGRLWTSDALPPRDAESARGLYEAWQLLDAAPSDAYPAPSQSFGVAHSTQSVTGAKPATWIALLLLALFLLERILTHARRN